jgi:hypothetical protein
MLTDDTPVGVAASALAFSLPAASTVRLAAPLTAYSDSSPSGDVSFGFTVTRRAPPPTGALVVDGGGTLTLTLLESISGSTERKAATVEALAALPAGDYVAKVQVAAAAAGTMQLRLSGQTSVAVVRRVDQMFSVPTIARVVTIPVEPTPPTPIATPLAFELVHESCICVSAPLTLLVENMNLATNRVGVHVSVRVTTAFPPPLTTTVYLSDVPVVASLNTDLLGGLRSIAVTPVACVTLPPGVYVVDVLAVVDSGIVPPVAAVVTGDVNALAVQSRIA